MKNFQHEQQARTNAEALDHAGRAAASGADAGSVWAALTKYLGAASYRETRPGGEDRSAGRQRTS